MGLQRNARLGLADRRALIVDVESGFAASNYELVGLVFWRWLNSDFAPNMVNTVEVYSAGNWITLWTSGGGPRHRRLRRRLSAVCRK